MRSIIPCGKIEIWSACILVVLVCCAAKTLQVSKNKKRGSEVERLGGAEERVPDPFLTGAAKRIVGLPHAVKELTS